jgi:vesicle coat complex subunit
VSLYDSPAIQEVVKSSIQILLSSDSSSNDRADAASILGGIADAQAIPPLCQALKDQAPEVRRNAAIALGEICHRTKCNEATIYLCEALYDPLTEVCCSVTLALGKIGDKNAVDFLHKIFDAKVEILFSIISAIEKISSHQSVAFLVSRHNQIQRIHTNLQQAVEAIKIQLEYDEYSLVDILKKINRGVERVADNSEQQASKYSFPKAEVVQIVENNQGGEVIAKKYVKDPQQVQALSDAILILQTLQNAHPLVTQAQAHDIIDVQFREIQANEPQRWQLLQRQLLNRERWLNGGKAALVEAAQTLADKLWLNVFIAFLDGFSADEDQGK